MLAVRKTNRHAHTHRERERERKRHAWLQFSAVYLESEIAKNSFGEIIN